jgi:hypothetical protein
MKKVHYDFFLNLCILLFSGIFSIYFFFTKEYLKFSFVFFLYLYFILDTYKLLKSIDSLQLELNELKDEVQQ